MTCGPNHLVPDSWVVLAIVLRKRQTNDNEVVRDSKIMRPRPGPEGSSPHGLRVCVCGWGGGGGRLERRELLSLEVLGASYLCLHCVSLSFLYLWGIH